MPCFDALDSNLLGVYVDTDDFDTGAGDQGASDDTMPLTHSAVGRNARLEIFGGCAQTPRLR